MSSILISATISALLSLSLPTAYAQDGRTYLNKTLRTYQGMNSYEGKSVVDLNILLPSGEKKPYSAESTSIAYKRPNKLALKLSSNKSSIEIYSDGKTLTVYHLDSQKYFSVPAPPDMTEMLKALHTRAGIDAILDPLFFLSASAIPETLRNIQLTKNMKNLPLDYKIEDQIGGRPAVSVACMWQSSNMLDRNFFMQDQARWFISLDKTNGRLLKTEARVPGKVIVRVMKQNKPAAMPMNITVILTHQVAQANPNANIPDSAFVFIPPKGSTVQKTPDDLVKKAKGDGGKDNDGVKF